MGPTENNPLYIGHRQSESTLVYKDGEISVYHNPNQRQQYFMDARNCMGSFRVKGSSVEDVLIKYVTIWDEYVSLRNRMYPGYGTTLGLPPVTLGYVRLKQGEKSASKEQGPASLGICSRRR